MAFCLATTQECLGSCQQFFRCKGLNQVVISTDLKSFYSVGNRVASCEHKDRHIVASRTQSTRNLQAIDTGKHDIKDHQIRRTLKRAVKSFMATCSNSNAVTFKGKNAPQQLCDTWVVID